MCQAPFIGLKRLVIRIHGIWYEAKSQISYMSNDDAQKLRPLYEVSVTK